MANSKNGPREYKTIPIANSVVVEPIKYFSKPDGWMTETADFTELSYFLGYKFEPRSMYAIWSPEGIARGGHLESRSKFVTVLQGQIYYVMVDMRPGEDKGKVFEFFLGEGEDSIGKSVLVPEGVIDAFVPVGGAALTHSVGDKPFNKFDNEMMLDVFDPELGLKKIRGLKYHSKEVEAREPLSLKEFLAKIK